MFTSRTFVFYLNIQQNSIFHLHLHQGLLYSICVYSKGFYISHYVYIKYFYIPFVFTSRTFIYPIYVYIKYYYIPLCLTKDFYILFVFTPGTSTFHLCLHQGLLYSLYVLCKWPEINTFSNYTTPCFLSGQGVSKHFQNSLTNTHRKTCTLALTLVVYRQKG